MRFGGRVGGGIGPFGGSVGGSIGRGGGSFGVGASGGPFHVGAGGRLPGTGSTGSGAAGCALLLGALVIVGLLVFLIAAIGPVIFGIGLIIGAALVPWGAAGAPGPRLSALVAIVVCVLGLAASVGVAFAMSGNGAANSERCEPLVSRSEPVVTTSPVESPGRSPLGSDEVQADRLCSTGGGDFLRGWAIVVSFLMAVAAALVFAVSLAMRLTAGDRFRRPTVGDPSQPVVAVAGQLPPAQWSNDPYRQARLRYWNGSEWTGHTSD